MTAISDSKPILRSKETHWIIIGPIHAFELKGIDRKPRKVLIMNKELHPRGDAGRLYVSRMEGGRGLI